jgi:hypothetical protein
MEDMQGIMSLPQEGAQAPGIDPQQMAVFDQMRQQISPKEFGDELLNGAMQADPEAVKAFRDELMALEVPIDTLMLLNEMVDVILANPQDYPALRREYLRRGVTEDVLPPTFDPAFFGALNMALDQMPVQQPQTPAQMAGGGIAQLAQYGRNGDTMLAHITPEEAAMLKRMGGAGTINPMTGLPEYGNIFSSIGKAVKKFASSTVGKIITTIALGFFLGPMVAGLGFGSTATAALTGFASSAGATLLGGGSLKESLKAGAIGGLTAGVVTGATNAFGQSVTSGGTQAPIESYGADGVKTLVSPGNAPQAALPGLETVIGGQGVDAVPPPPGGQVGAPLAPRPDLYPPAPIEGVSPLGSQASGQTFAPRPALFNANAANSMYAEPGSDAFSAISKPLPDLMQGQQAAGFSTTPGAAPLPTSQTSLIDKAKGLYQEYMPEALGGSRGAVPLEVTQKAETAYLQKLADTGSKDLASKAYDAIIKAGTPGMLSTYGPAAALALGATALAGGFKTEPATMPLGKQETGFDYLSRYPERYKLEFGGISGARNPYNPYMSAPRGMAEGGIAALEMGGTTYPRKTGHISGPGTGTSDSIPALLSDGEFVFTAKAVRAMGRGSRRKGAKKLYSMMKMLEKRQG